MGQAAIGGIITSSILTLIAVPVVYTYLDDLVAWAKRKWGHAGSGHAHGGQIPAVPHDKRE